MNWLAVALLLVSSTAVAQPAAPDEAPPAPAAAADESPPPPPAAPAPAAVVMPPATTPPIVTISTMPVTKTIPGYWDDEPRTTAWIVTASAGAVAAGLLVWHFAYGTITHVDRAPRLPGCDPTDGSQNCQVVNEQETLAVISKRSMWKNVDLGFGVATGAAALLTAYAWSRHYHASRSILVSPTTTGGEVSYSGSF